MPDIQLNAKSITTTSATTAPAIGASETWTVTALAAGIPTLLTDETYALIDATAGASSSQQAEIVRVTAATAGATSITVTRGADGTTPVAHANPSTFNIVIVASYMSPVTNMVRLAQDTGRALRTFRGSYLGGVTGNPTDILLVGASFEEGYGTTLMTNGWTNVFRDVLRAHAQPKGVSGGGAIPASNSTYQAGVGNYFGYSPFNMAPSGNYPDSPIIAAVANSGAFNPITTFGLGLRGLQCTNTSSFTIEFFGTGCDLVYSTDPTWGTFTWAVDGGSTTSQATTAASGHGARVQIRNLARGRHTVQCITTANGSSGLGVAHEGAVFYDGDESSGIRLWQGAKAGAKATDFATNNAWTSSIQTWNLPDLVIINLGYNDIFASSGARTAAQVKTDIQTIITNVKSRCNTLSAGFVPSFVLMSSFNVTATGSSPVDTWANAVKAFYEVAIADDSVCIFDYQHWFGKDTETTATTRGGILISDGLHPTDGGAAIIGGALADFVLDSSERMRDLRRFGVDVANPVYSASIAAQGAGFATDTYLTKSSCLIPNGRLKPETFYRCKFSVTKTGAGVATPIINVRIGTAGAIGDTSRAILTFAAQTAVIDEGFFEVFVTFRTVGSGTIAVIQAVGTLAHRLSITGLSTDVTGMKLATSSGFDSTVANSIIGISVNGGTSAAWTVALVQAELQNLA